MSVLIKGMKMPKTCEDCQFHRYHSHHEYVCVATPLFYPMNLANSEGIRKDWCPLVELPEKHGDLKDMDKVIPKLNFINEAEHQIYRGASWGFTAKCIQALDDAPTVIEAEDGT